jgi:hypothetical protein
VNLSDGRISKEEAEEGGRVMVCLLRCLQRDAEGIYFLCLNRKSCDIYPSLRHPLPISSQVCSQNFQIIRLIYEWDLHRIAG